MHDTLTNKTQPALLDATGLLVAVSHQPCGQCVVPNAGSQEGCALAFRCFFGEHGRAFQCGEFNAVLLSYQC